MSKRQAIARGPRLRWLLVVALAWLGTSATVAAQSNSLHQLLDEAAALMNRTTSDDSPSEQPDDEYIVPEVLPPPTFEGRLPLAGAFTGDVELSQSRDGLITLRVRDASLSRVLALLAQTHDLNIVAASDIDAMISITLRDVPLDEALTAILSVANYTWVKRNNIILITSMVGAANLPADVQGRQIQVFELDFASARVVAQAITGFLSPIGSVTVSESNPTNNRLTRELVIVEDLPLSLARIADYIWQVDQPPRQVLIEAHILQVNLDNSHKGGVNLSAIARHASSNLTLKTAGFANAAASPAFLATLEGGDVGSVVELLQTTTDSKTLGSPKLLVLNEQEARIQVGDQIGYLGATTTTELMATQAVEFLEVGVVLKVIPRITRDNRVLLHVKPEVSTGQINPVTSAPDKSTTELETDVMLEDGQGMVLGGLIKEIDSVNQAKVPYLGDVRGIGWLFRRTERTKSRVEIIVALVPRIQPYDCQWAAYEQGELVRASVPLFHGPLNRTPRPWDPVLPDGDRVQKPLVPRRHAHRTGRHYHNPGPRYVVPPYPLPEQSFYGAPCVEPRHLPPVHHHHPSQPFLSDDVEHWDGPIMLQPAP